ncbi:IS256 family transposase (plasmid) [Pseudomonas aeruginosa]|uniref:IS256 family transposase n=1 Tax=Pseudomonas aeruginosa TaxID=287 RepID=UPI00249F483B|nr:IS256 family transposase [Pseudomonas aeruginosa]EIW4151678.1 IS256 family transposase [Pseudomonas aeruginosa]EKU5858223.1 IS256 family transposase [Pseudomonas aeruginosa]WGX59116.1 IS256 family transposase [Pseudomonas aeruginosa]
MTNESFPNIDPKLIDELAKQVKTEQDLAALSRHLMKLTVERALAAELDDHLGYDKHAPEGKNTGNSRNGAMAKTLKGDFGEVEIRTPRDRKGTFEPLLVRKGQTRFTAFDDQILALYARGMTTRDIADMFQQMYGADISHSLIAKVTDAVLDEVVAWQNRPLDAVYPIVYLDCLVIKVQQDKRVINKSLYLALGVNLEGHKELLGLWIAETEGAKFWLSVLTELQNRGVKDIFIACVDGLSGFPDAIAAAYPKTRTQLCIVHMVRNSLRYVASKHMKAVAADLKTIYHAPTREAAEQALDAFAATWDDQYASISKSWRQHWANLITLFDYPPEIRKIIYTTNAIESLNSVIRKAIKNRKIFPGDTSVFKMVYLAIMNASKKWTMPLREWKPALNRFMIEYGDRVPELN